MTDITKFNRNGAIRDIGDSKSRANFAPSFTTTIGYSTNDLTIQDGILYKFITDHEAGEWNSNHVERSNINNEFLQLSGGTLKNKLTISTTDNSFLYLKNEEITTGVTSLDYKELGAFTFKDSNDLILGYLNCGYYPDQRSRVRLAASQQINNNMIRNALDLYISSDGTKKIGMTDPQIWRDALNLGHLKIYASLLDFSNDDTINNNSTYIDLFNAMEIPSILILAPGYCSFPEYSTLGLPGNGTYIHFKSNADRNFGIYAYGTKNNATNRNLKLSRIYVDSNDENKQKILWSTITTTE